MRRWFAPFALAIILSHVLGCGLGGESTLDAMKRRAIARAAANKEAEERAKLKAAQQEKEQAPTPPLAVDDRPEDAAPAVPVPTQDQKSGAAQGSQAAGDEPHADAVLPAAAGGDPAAIRPPIPTKPEPPLSEVQRRNLSALNLDQIIKALNKHARDKGTYPTQAIVDKRLGRPLLSWRVAILADLGYGEFYKEFKLTEPWDSPHNLALLKHIPPAFVSPERCDEKTNYLAPHGPGTSWDGIRGKDPLSFGDGADTTLIVLEADESAAVPWTKPEDLTAGSMIKSRLGNLRGEGFLAAFGSGYVAMIHNKITYGQLSWMLSPDGDDFLTDRSIIFDATVPDVALVTNEPPPGEEQPMEGGDAGKPTEPDKTAAAGSAGSSAVNRLRPGELPPVVLPTLPKKPERLPLPTEDELAKVREELRGIYQQEYRDAKTKGDRQKLVGKMIADAARMEEESAAYYEMLQVVREIAAQLGDLTTALKAVELLETRFEIPPLELRLQSLDEVAGAAGKDPGASSTQLASEAEKVMVSAYKLDDFDRALEAHQIMASASRLRSDRAQATKVAAYRTAIQEAEKAYKLVPAALSALATNPDNTQANDVAGKYFCLIKEEWDIGLPMLARGQDLRLRLLARMDLEPSHTGPDRVQLADHYWDLAQKFPQPQRRSLETRAAFHYATARPLLTPGVDLVKAEKRIEEVNRNYRNDLLARSGGGTSVLPPIPTVNPNDDSG